MTRDEWLASLKEGDEVLVEYGSYSESIRTIERITNTQFVLAESQSRYRRKDGFSVGESGYYRGILRPVTDSARNRLRAVAAKDGIDSAVRKLDLRSATVEQADRLERALAVLRAPADDGELVTAEWLNERFKNWYGNGGRIGWELLAVCIIRPTDKGFVPVFSHTGEGSAGATLSTRGDVRTLCRALGLTLKETRDV